MQCYTIRSVVAATLTSSCALTSLVASRYLHCSIRDGDLMLQSAHSRTEFVRSVLIFRRTGSVSDSVQMDMFQYIERMSLHSSM